MFRTGPSDTDNVHFLEGIVSDQKGRDLTGQDDDGDGVHEGGGDSCHRIGGTRPGGNQSHSDLSCGSGISVCRMDCQLVHGGPVSDGMGHPEVRQKERVRPHRDN